MSRRRRVPRRVGPGLYRAGRGHMLRTLLTAAALTVLVVCTVMACTDLYVRWTG